MRKMLDWVREALIPRGQSAKQIARNMALTLALQGVAALLCILLNTQKMPETAIPMVFVLAVLLTARFTEGYFYGMFATVASVIAVNYVFTYPYFEINFVIAGYPLTFLTMFAVSLVVGMLTEQVKRQSRIEAMAEREKTKANMLRGVSHDLRTPLTSIIGSSNAVLENYEQLDDEKKKELISHVRDDAQWLMQMVENILSITRINDQAVRLRKSPEAVEEIVAEAVGKFRKKREMPVHVVVPDELMMVPMDATLIEQVIVNLLENVVIHAKGATKIELRVTREGNAARFAVTDDGKGIEKDVLPKLFEELFPYAKENAADGRRSMGIGLSACKSIVVAHGGNMHAQNLPQGGACMSFVLPIEEDTNYAG